MANNLVVQLLLKTGTFSTDLKQAKGQIQQFQQGCSTAGKSLDAFGKGLGINISSLTKFGTVVGVAAAAGKVFKEMIDSNQVSADKFEGVIAGCKGVVESFTQAMAMADFSSFRDGIWSVFEAATNARNAMDAMNDAAWAFSYESGKNQDEFNQLRNVATSEESTQEEKDAAVARMKEIVSAQWAAARSMGKKELDTYIAMIVKEAGAANISAYDVTLTQFEKAVSIKLHGNSADEERINNLYKEYLRKRREFGKNNITAQEQLKRQYADVIAVHAMIHKMNDDEIQQVAKILTDARNANSAATAMERTLNNVERRLNNSSSGSGSGSGGGSYTSSLGKKIEAQEGSLAYWQKIVSEKQKARDMEVFNSESWQRLDNELLEAIENVDRLEAGLRRLRFEQSGMNTPLAMPENAPVGKAEVMDKGGLVGVPRTTPVPTETINSWEVYSETLSGVASVASSLSNILGAVIDDETAKKWESFFKVVNGVATVFSALASVIQTVTALQKTFQAVTAATATANAAAAATESAAIVAAKGAEAGAAAAAAGAEGASAVAGVPVVGPALAIAAAAAIVAAIIAAMTKARGAGKFAYGGIVGGNSFTGDRLVANVNSGEMILNKTQQARLFKLANGGAVGGNQVEFHISGTELVGVINNVNRKNRVIG